MPTTTHRVFGFDILNRCTIIIWRGNQEDWIGHAAKKCEEGQCAGKENIDG
jgi:hypothetical protein